MEAVLPKQKGQCLEKGLEVVVVIYCRLLNQLNVSKHLRQQESRWCLLNANPKPQRLLVLQYLKYILHITFTDYNELL